MLKQQYNHVGLALRDILIREFLEQHPDTYRSQVVTRTVNGRPVCDTVDNVAREAIGKRRFGDHAKEREFVLRQCELSADDRHQACLDSIAHSRKMIEFLSSTKRRPFAAKDRHDNLNFLDRYERISVDRGHVVLQINKELTAQLQRNRASSRASVRSHIVRYFHALLDQLKCQAAIYKREFKLGERVRGFARDFIGAHLDEVRANVESDHLSEATKACRLIGDSDGELHKLTTGDRKELEAALVTLGARLEKRRVQVTELQRIIVLLEKLVTEMKCDDRRCPQKTPQAKRANAVPRGRSRMYSVGAEMLRRFDRCLKRNSGLTRTLEVD